MRPRRKYLYLAVVLSLAAVLLIATAVLVTSREPVFEGKRVSEWIELLDPHVAKRDQHDQAAEAMRQIGAAAVPVIARMLEPETGRITERIPVLLRRFRILPPLTLSPNERHYRAARAAYTIAERSDADISSLVPRLTFHLLDSNYLDSEAGRALAGAGPEGVAALTNLVIHPDQRVRDRAIYSLSHARGKPGVYEAFLRSVDDEDQSVRFAAVSSLGREPRRDPAVVVPIGLRFLEKTDPYGRWAAARLLAGCLQDDRAKAALQRALDDPDERVRSTAARALKEKPGTPRP